MLMVGRYLPPAVSADKADDPFHRLKESTSGCGTVRRAA